MSIAFFRGPKGNPSGAASRVTASALPYQAAACAPAGGRWLSPRGAGEFAGGHLVCLGSAFDTAVTGSGSVSCGRYIIGVTYSRPIWRAICAGRASGAAEQSTLNPRVRGFESLAAHPF
jgi:hypothetical protein